MRVKTIHLVLTLAEARALSEAAGNATAYADVMENLFRHRMQRAACVRAHAKLDDAIREGGR